MIPVAGHEQRIAEPSGAQILKERPHHLDILLRASHQSKQDLAPVLADPPSGEDRLTPLARPQPLGKALDEQIDDGVRKIALERSPRIRPADAR